MVVTSRSTLLAGLSLAAFAASPIIAVAQEQPRIIPTNGAVITGYGTVGYQVRTQGDNQNAFSTSVSPVFLFQFQDRILFETELEFEVAEGITETGLEYAQLDFIASDNLVLVAGKFLLPFGVFGDRLHPTWINKFATSPPIYGHHVASSGATPLLPILSDVGVMARGSFNPGNLQVGINAFVTQGPSIEAGSTDEIPELEFQASSGDENTNKMFGGRIDIGLLPQLEVNVSYLNGDYDESNVLDFTAWNVAGEFRVSDIEVRGEYIRTSQEYETLTGFPSFVRDGFYGQAAYRWREWQPVLRWTQIFDSAADGVANTDGARQIGIGLDYWFNPSLALMAGYEINKENGLEIDNDRLVAHVAFGF